MMKKTIIACIFLTTNSVFALNASDASSYVGGGIGKSLQPQSGVTGNLFGGYGERLGQNKKIYLGGELGAKYNTGGHTTGVDASIMPGYMLTDVTMVYGRAGFDTGYTSHKSGYFKFGTEVGLGLQTNIAKNWDMRGEFVSSNAQPKNQYNLGLVYKLN